MQVFRVEHPETFDGPFNSYHGFYCGEVRALYSDPIHFPAAWDDCFDSSHFIAGNYRDHVCGLDTLKLLRYWFEHPIVVPRLAACGYQITEFDVHPDNVRFGKSLKQLMFDRTKAKLVKRLPIQEVLRCEE